MVPFGREQYLEGEVLRGEGLVIIFLNSVNSWRKYWEIFAFSVKILLYSTCHGHYTRVNCHWIACNLVDFHAKNSRVIFTRAFASIFAVTDFACYKYTQVVLISLQQQLTGAHDGWCEIRNRHRGKTSFCGGKENNLLYILCFQLSLTTNVMFCKSKIHVMYW